MEHIILKDKTLTNYYLVDSLRVSNEHLCQTYFQGTPLGCQKAGCYAWNNEESGYRLDLLLRICESVPSRTVSSFFIKDYAECRNLVDVKSLLKLYKINFDISDCSESHRRVRTYNFINSYGIWTSLITEIDGDNTLCDWKELPGIGGLSADEIYEVFKEAPIREEDIPFPTDKELSRNMRFRETDKFRFVEYLGCNAAFSIKIIVKTK